MTDKELIARLRQDDTDFWHCEAADRIEALVTERDQWIEHTKNAVWSDSEELKLASARAERLEAALRKIAEGNFIGRAEGYAFAALKGADHE